MKNVLAFDYGGGSGRAVLGSFDGEKITLKEVHRFDNEPVQVNGGFYWDILRLFEEMKRGISKASQEADFESIGIDSWGVDYGMISKSGVLVSNPYHYRDERSVPMVDEVGKKVSMEELYMRTGNQIMNINTIFQLAATMKNNSDIMSITDKILMTPDLLSFFLTGEKYTEMTMASTTGLMNPFTKEWDFELIEKIGLPKSIFPGIIKSGTVVGKLREDLCRELGISRKKVVAVAGHDTASAVVAVPCKEEEFAFISCGTWSLFGSELKSPIVNETSMKENLTNETGFGATTHFLNNIIGLWMIQESRRAWRRKGVELSYAEMEKEALASKAMQCFVDPDAPEFVPAGNIPERVRDFCRKTGQYVPQTIGEVVRCIYESLAFKYKYTLEKLERCMGRSFENLHIIGGGTKDGLLCALTADATHLNVIAGPTEATALGNVAVQLMALGEIKDVAHARKIISSSTEVKHYSPNSESSKLFDEKYEEFKKILLK